MTTEPDIRVNVGEAQAVVAVEDGPLSIAFKGLYLTAVFRFSYSCLNRLSQQPPNRHRRDRAVIARLEPVPGIDDSVEARAGVQVWSNVSVSKGRPQRPRDVDDWIPSNGHSFAANHPVIQPIIGTMVVEDDVADSKAPDQGQSRAGIGEECGVWLSTGHGGQSAAEYHEIPWTRLIPAADRQDPTGG